MPRSASRNVPLQWREANATTPLAKRLDFASPYRVLLLNTVLMLVKTGLAMIFLIVVYDELQLQSWRPRTEGVVWGGESSRWW